MTKLSPIPPQPLASRHKGLLPQPTPCTGTPCVCPRHCPSRDIYFKLRQLLCLIQCVTPDEARAGFPHSSLFTPLPSLLAFGRSGLFGPPLCGGSAPATPPLLKPPAAASVWLYDLDDPLRPGLPPTPASWHIQSMCQRRQDRRGNSHTYPTFTAMTIASRLQKYSRYIPPDRPHTAHTEHGLVLQPHFR